jgi:hypothetical protein
MDHAARLASGVLLEQSFSFLTSAVGGVIASFGDSCWLTDESIRERIRMPNGRKPHRESVARVRRFLRDRGVINSTRVFVNGRLPTHAKYDRSTRGTTINAFQWRVISTKSPFSRRERQLTRYEQERKAREEGQLQKRPASPQPAPRHSAPQPSPAGPPRVPSPLQRDPEIDEMARVAQAALERHAAARAAASASCTRSEPDSGHAPLAAERGPPE